MTIDPKPCHICHFPTGYFAEIKKDLRLLNAIYRNTLLTIIDNDLHAYDNLPPEFLTALKQQLKLITKMLHYCGN